MRRRLALATMLLVGLAAGCGNPSQRDARSYFDQGYAAFEEGRWVAARDNFTLYLNSNPPDARRAEVHYYRGLAEVHLERRGDAKADFLKSLALEPKPPIDHFAHVALGNVYYEEGDDAGAIAQFAPVVRAAPSDVPLDRIILRMSISLQRIGKWTIADAYLDYLVKTYPSAPTAEEGRRRLHVGAFTVQTGAFSSVLAANTEIARLRKAGFAPRTVQTTGKSGQPLQAVQVGSCKTYGEASALAQRLHKVGFSTLVVP